MEENNEIVQDVNTKEMEIINKMKNETSYEKAKEIVEEALQSTDITEEQKAMIEYQLYLMALHQINYEEETRIAQNLINNENFPKELKIELQIVIIKNMRRENKISEAKAYAKSILDSWKVSIEDKILVLEQLKKMARDAKDSKKARSITQRIKRMKEKLFENEKVEYEKKKRNIPKVKITPDEKRQNLYNGTINEDWIKSIVDENNSNIKGCIYIAEVCKYFGLEPLGLQCLKGTRKKFQEMTLDEKKAISKAEELLKNQKIAARSQEYWDDVYAILERNVVSIDDDGR